jgi:hypothetical protein
MLSDGSFHFHLPGNIDEVQQWLHDDGDVPENEYEQITCPACTRLHFLNRKTRKLLGQDEE